MQDFAVEISKLLPVKDIYEDAAQPAARQAGAISGDLMKVLHLALAPVQLAAALQDRFRAFIDQSVRKVPEERRIQPAPQIAGPVLEGIRYEPAGTEIDEMFSNLLANAMDVENHGRSHPAYPNIIKQLSRDEAVILSTLCGNEYNRIEEYDFDEDIDYFGQPSGIIVDRRVTKDDFPIDKLFLSDRFDFYIGHLNTLGLAGLYGEASEPIYQVIDEINRRQIGSRQQLALRLTALGKEFVAACQRPAQAAMPEAIRRDQQ